MTLDQDDHDPLIFNHWLNEGNMKQSDKYFERKDGREKKYIPNLRGQKTKEGQIGFATKQEAIDYYDQAMADAQNGKYVKRSNNPTFAKVANAWLEEAEADKTKGAFQEAKRNILFVIENVPGLKKMRILDVRAGFIQQKILPVIFRQSHSTGTNRYHTLRQIFNFAMTNEWIGDYPLHYVKLPKAPTRNQAALAPLISHEKIKLIIQNAGKDWLKVKFAALTGLRPQEQVVLRFSDLDLDDIDNAAVSVTKAMKKGRVIGEPKTAHGYRIVALDSGLAEDLRAYRDEALGVTNVVALPNAGQPNDRLIWPNSVGNYADHFKWRGKILHPACERANVDKIRWYDLRHYFASTLIYDSQYDDHEVRVFMGHSDDEMTLYYSHWLNDPRRDKRKAAKMTAAFSGRV